ncbi:MAG: hypothetical protein OHK0017_12030 [Patescibacteria group bacterium]
MPSKQSSTDTSTGSENSTGFLHELPDDIAKALNSNVLVLEKWNSLTPLARNEWICWVTIVKQQKTRDEHISRLLEEVGEGEKRPCCWPGCPHRRPKSAKWFKGKKGGTMKYEVKTS